MDSKNPDICSEKMIIFPLYIWSSISISSQPDGFIEIWCLRGIANFRREIQK